ncbi:MAG TPA: glutamate racemase [Thermoflexia bacterium]|nr:glutamate racemase [Thermoflexia bacterium]
MASSSNAPIGIFDSGVGGLSVWRALVQRLPHEGTLYLADQAHVPYGPRPLAEVTNYAKGITRFLLAHGAKLIVVACNTASGAALHTLRETFPAMPFVGMEPAVKPAAEATRSGVVGIIATPATFQGKLFQQLVQRFTSEVQLETQTCPGLVELIETGTQDAPETEILLRQYLQPLVERGIDQLVLGCTHYPFLRQAMQRVVGERVTLIDPAPAVARQIERRLRRRRIQALPGTGQHTFFTTGDPLTFAEMAQQLVGYTGAVNGVHWGKDCEIERR